MSLRNIIFENPKLDDTIFNVIGIINRNPTSSEEKELCDIKIVRYRCICVMENYSVLKITTRTGGGNRLDYKENIRDIRDHSLYIADCDQPDTDTYAWWYLRVPIEKKQLLKKLYPVDYTPPILDKTFETEEKVWNILYNPDYACSDSDTDYSDMDNFKHRYGYWYSDVGESETDDEMSDDENIDDSMNDETMNDETINNNMRDMTL